MKRTWITGIYFSTKFKPGDVAVSRVNINFLNGTQHRTGDKILVTKENEEYFNIHHNDYDQNDDIQIPTNR